MAEKLYKPALELRVVRSVPVAVCIAVTLAFAITPPDESVTEPLIVAPPLSWAPAESAQSKSAKMRQRVFFRILVQCTGLVFQIKKKPVSLSIPPAPARRLDRARNRAIRERGNKTYEIFIDIY